MIFLLPLLLSFVRQAQSVTAANVQSIDTAVVKNRGQPRRIVLAKAKKEFLRDFGNLPVQRWRKHDGFFIATFRCAGSTLDAYYAGTGGLAGLCRQIHFRELPEEAQAFIGKKYKGYAAVKVIRFTAQKAYHNDVMLFTGHFPAANASFVELAKENTKLVLKINEAGDIHFFKEL